MAETTAIEWAHSTFNPWIGCTRVSAACDHCYAATLGHNRFGVEWGAGQPRRRTSPGNWREPIRWNKAAAAAGERRRVFCASLADVFDAEVPDEWRQDLFALIDATPALDWLLLTKRPKLMAEWSQRQALPRNVWAGTTVEDQKMANLRIPQLLQVQGGAVRFLSCEPLLGQVDLAPWLSTPDGFWQALNAAADQNFVRGNELTEGYAKFMKDRGTSAAARVDWVIAGGESGAGARPSHPDWFRSLRDQCQAAGVAFLFKQWGDHVPAEFVEFGACGEVWRKHPDGSRRWSLAEMRELSPAKIIFNRIGKKAAGRVLDGRTWDGVAVVNHGEA